MSKRAANPLCPLCGQPVGQTATSESTYLKYESGRMVAYHLRCKMEEWINGASSKQR